MNYPGGLNVITKIFVGKEAREREGVKIEAEGRAM